MSDALVTEERLSALEAAAKAATPDVVVTPMGGQAVSPRDGYFLRSTDALGVQTDVAHVRNCPTLTSGELEANARLFAEARPAVLALVAEVRRLRGLLLSLIASMGLADHMGDVADDVGKVLKDLPLDIEWNDLDDLRLKLGASGVRTVWGTEIGPDKEGR